MSVNERLDREMAALDDPSVDYSALKHSLWPGASVVPEIGRAGDATLLRMYPAGTQPRAGSLCSTQVDVDSHWHLHDMHQLIYPFEGAIEVEVEAGRHLIPRQLAAWIPAGVAHRASLHNVRSVVVFFPRAMVPGAGDHIRVLLVSSLLREMMRESMRWPLHAPDSPLRVAFFKTMALLCREWIESEADLFLPSSDDPRLKRALDFTARNCAARLPDVCQHAGMSQRSLRRHVKAQFGMSWESYRQRSRLIEAITLLAETDASIGDIAARCGFESSSAFAKAFRGALGEAPREYRRRSHSR